MYMFDTVGDNGDPIAMPSSYRYMSDPNPKCVCVQKVSIAIRLSIDIKLLG